MQCNAFNYSLAFCMQTEACIRVRHDTESLLMVANG